MKCCIYLENGLFLEAKSFGAEGTSVGEIVFNTSMSGYQEIISDPSYAGQFVTFTMPEIGNVGCNAQDMESKGAYSKGIIVRNYNEEYSNFRGTQTLRSFLKEHGVMGICDIDTRYLTKTLRDSGSMMMIASTTIHDKEELAKMLESSKRIEEINYIQDVSTKEPYIHTEALFDFATFNYAKAPASAKKILVLDFGVKRAILNNLAASGLEIEVVPNSYSTQEIIARFKAKEIAGIFLSNGPGDPLILSEEKAKIQELIAQKIPMFAICLGHQLLSIAHGFDTYKLKFGHHGGNHPVKNAEGVVEITAQNHNYNVPDSIKSIAQVTHTNLFDNTIEGLKYNDAPIFSVQHHPEASPGPLESSAIFKEFKEALW